MSQAFSNRSCAEAPNHKKSTMMPTGISLEGRKLTTQIYLSLWREVAQNLMNGITTTKANM